MMNDDTIVPPPGRRKKSRPTPIPISPRTRLVLLLAGIALAIAVMWVVPTVLIIALGGFGLALVLSFPVRTLNLYLPRAGAIAVSLLLVVLSITVVGLLLVPILVDQFSSLVRAMPGIADTGEQRLNEWLAWARARGIILSEPGELAAGIRADITDFTASIATGVLGRITGFVTGTFQVVLTFFGILFVGIYLLIDVRTVKAAYLRAAPHRYRKDALALWEAFAVSMSRYLGGLAVILFVQGALSALALFLIGVPYSLILGAWVSVTAIIPFVGAFLGAIPAVIVAFTISPTTVILTIVLFTLIQQFESNILTPRVQGKTLRVHPILVFLAVIVGGGLAGMIGVILAVPALAACRVLFDFLRVRLVVKG
jgi:predicted PurR-regulated permease PerM